MDETRFKSLGMRAGGARCGARIAIVILALSGTPAIVVPAVAQTPSGPAAGQQALSEFDAVHVRELSRVRPELAAKLKADLSSGSLSDAQRDRIFNEYDSQLQHEIDDYNKTPKEVRRAHLPERDDTARRLIGQMRTHDVTGTVGYLLRQSFEDEVVKKARFTDYHELYAVLREKYPDDLGAGFMQRLAKLQPDSQEPKHGSQADRNAYYNELNRLSREAAEYRANNGEKAPSIANEIQSQVPARPAIDPYSPSAQCVENSAMLRESATKAIKDLQALKQQVARANNAAGNIYRADFAFFAAPGNVFDRETRRLNALLKILKKGRKTDCDTRKIIEAGMGRIKVFAGGFTKIIQVVNEDPHLRKLKRMVADRARAYKRFNSATFF